MHGVARKRLTAASWIGPILFLVSLILYLATSSAWVSPGASADFAVRHTGLAPYSVYTHGIWNWVAGAFLKLPLPGTLVYRLSLLSALCGALSVWLMYAVHARIRHDKSTEENHATFASSLVQRLTGVVAALVLAACVPFWIVSTRPHPYAFDALILLAAALSLQTFDQNRRWIFLYLSAAIWGVGIVEFPSFVLMTPLFAWYAFVSIFSPPVEESGGRLQGLFAALEPLFHEPRRIGQYPLGGLILAFLLGLSCFFVLGYQYAGSPSAEWAGLDSYGAVLVQMGKLHYLAIMRSVPRLGWLLIGLTCIIPWLAVVALPKRTMMRREAIWGSGAMHLVLTVLVLALAANVSFSPWRILGGRGLVIIPYVLTASLTGYLAGYWYAILFGLRSRRRPPARRPFSPWQAAYLAALACLVGTAAWLNFRSADARRAAFAQKYAASIVEHLDGRSWIIGTGPIMNPLRIALYEAGSEANVLDLALLSQPVYRAYLDTLMDQPKLHSVMEVGPVALLKEWFRLDADLGRKLAVVFYADLLAHTGQDPLVREACYVPMPLEDRPKADEAFMERCRNVWDAGQAAIVDAGVVQDPYLETVRDEVASHLGKLANDVGVLMEDEKRDAQAAEAYNRALDLDEGNLSALLNLYMLTERLESVQHAEIKTRVEEVVREEETRNILTMTRLHGSLRDPYAFRDMGFRFAQAGEGERAVRELERARNLGARAGGVRGLLGDLYLQNDRLEESRQEYEIILKNRPDHVDALMGMAYLRSNEGDVSGADAYLDRALKAGADSSRVSLERALVRFAAGYEEDGQAMLEAYVDDHPGDSEAGTIYARFLVGGGRLDEARAILERMRSDLPDRPALITALGTTYLMLGENGRARNYFTKAANQFGHPMALTRLIQMDLNAMEVDRAASTARRLLSQDPSDAWGNYALGLNQHQREDFDLAESSYRRALERERLPEVLNSLAWLLLEGERYDEALPLAEECTKADPEYYSAWDTLGAIYLRLERLDDATQAFTRAFELAPENPATQVHMLELYEAKGMTAEARDLADSLLGAPDSLSTDQRDLIKEITKRLK